MHGAGAGTGAVPRNRLLTVARRMLSSGNKVIKRELLFVQALSPCSPSLGSCVGVGI